MYRYVALIWNFLDLRASAQANEWAKRFEVEETAWRRTFVSPGMRIYTQPPRIPDMQEYRLPAERGVILGRLFPAELDALAPGWNPAIAECSAACFLASGGRRLTEEYWGAYIAFLRSPLEPHCAVLRDPSGKIPCYRLRHAEVDIVFSDVTDLACLSLPPFALNLRYLAVFLYRDYLQVRETGLAGVSEILAGECFEVRAAAASQRIAWDAVAIASDRDRASYEQAAVRLRDVTQRCIDAWASVHPRILHFLSGGLDSSIVLGCLSRSRAPASVVCMNHYLESAEGDERTYARIAASRAHVRLIERLVRAADSSFDFSLLEVPRSPRPCFSRCDRWTKLDAINAAAAALSADAVWTGQGGDHLFLKSEAIASAADFLVDNGFRPGLARTIDDEARLSRRPYLHVWRSALAARQGRDERSRSSPEQLSWFVRQDALPDSLEDYLAPPWTRAARRLPPGRQYQIAFVAEVVNRHMPIAGAEVAFQHHPLLSQPILEQCLRTPSYLHLRGGRPRALARDAFKDRVPPEILQREDKGNSTSLVAESIRGSAPFLCELLLDGILVEERLAERASLARYLKDELPLGAGQLPALAACIAAEIWARSWCGGELSVARRRAM